MQPNEMPNDKRFSSVYGSVKEKEEKNLLSLMLCG